ARAAAATARARAAELAAAEASAALESARTDAAARRVAARARAAEAAAADAEVARLRVQAEREAGRAAAAAATNERLATLQDYLKVLRPGGIAALLLEKARALVARFINDGLRELGAPLEADLTPEFALLQRARPGQTSAGPWLAASLASGYQKFVLGLAARLALWRLTAAPRLDALFIDEGFSSCDAEYLEGLGSALEALASAPNAPRLVFVVSHLDALKTRLERVLEIRRGPHGSRVMNAATETKSLPAAPAAIQSAPALAAALAPDPKDPAKLWCRACRQSLNAGNGPRHLSSQKHERAART
ncbi:MAG TPA: hypothetical protein VNI01_15870, partial [Elusimicrobiota bacterium]|nr:hypothetical protein [Elusimicrobiota bacterium]